MMNYRILDPSEWDKLKPIVEEKYLPRPDSAAAAVAEDDSGMIVGVWFMQLTIHLEPLILKSPQVSFMRLFDVLMEVVKKDKGLRFYAFTDREIVNKMAEHVGMRAIPYTIYEGEVR